MATVGSLVVEMRTKFAKFYQGMSKARGSMRQTGQSAQRVQKQMESMGSSINRVAAIVGASLSVRQVKEYADSWTRVNNQMRVIASETEDVAALTNRLFEAAQNTRAPVEALVTLYSRAAMASDKLGASQNQLISFTENVGKALLVNGTNAQESRGALIQLSQAIGAGVVRAEEFNAILDGGRPILAAVARGLKEAAGDVSTLRQLVVSGQVSSQAFFKAFLIGSKKLEEQFKTTNATISQSFTLLKNSMTRFVGLLNESGGASTALGEALSGVTARVDALDAELISTKVAVYFKRWSHAAEDVNTQLVSAQSELQLMGDIGAASAGFISTAFAEMPSNLVTAVRLAITEIASLFDRTAAKLDILRIKFLKFTVEKIDGPKPMLAAMLADAEDNLSRLQGVRQQSIIDIVDAHNKQKIALDGQIATARALAAERQKALKTEAAILQSQRAQELAALREGGSVSIKDFPAQVLGKGGGRTKLDSLFTDNLKAETAAWRRATQVYKETRTPLENLQATYKELNLLLEKGVITQDTYKRAVLKSATSYEEMANKVKDQSSAMSVYADQAARNMQDSFANFLFDPFDDGLKGMLKGFLDVIRRIAAEQAASTLFGSKSEGGLGLGDLLKTGIMAGLGSFGFGGAGAGSDVAAPATDIRLGLEDFKIPGLAKGGRAAAGKVHLVGEEGPELMVPDVSGTVIPNNQIGGRNITVIQNISTPAAGSFRKASSRISLDISRQLARV